MKKIAQKKENFAETSKLSKKVKEVKKRKFLK